MSKIAEVAQMIIALFFSSLKLIAASIITKILSTFGLTMVTFNSVLPALKSFVMNYIMQLPPQALDFLGAIGVDVAASMVISALTTRLAFKFILVPTATLAALRAG